MSAQIDANPAPTYTYDAGDQLTSIEVRTAPTPWQVRQRAHERAGVRAQIDAKIAQYAATFVEVVFPTHSAWPLATGEIVRIPTYGEDYRYAGAQTDMYT